MKKSQLTIIFVAIILIPIIFCVLSFKSTLGISDDNYTYYSKTAAISSYKYLLKEILEKPSNYYYTDGYSYSYEENDQNGFSVADINNDDILDLIVRFKNTSETYMNISVWTINNLGKIEKLFAKDYYTDFYKNNYIKTEDNVKSYNYLEDYPFTISKYNEDINLYEDLYYVRILRDNGSSYNPYLIENDLDSDGIIYEVNDLVNGTENYLTLEEYNELINNTIPEENKLDIHYAYLTEDNINLLDMRRIGENDILKTEP